MPPRAQRVTDFLDWLRERGGGFEAGDQQYLAAHELLETMAALGQWPTSEDQWRTLLATVVCSSALQQEQFYELFDTWFGKAPEQRVDGETEGFEERSGGRSTRRRLYVWAGIAASVLLLATGLAPTTTEPTAPSKQLPTTAAVRDDAKEALPSQVTLTVQQVSGQPLRYAAAYFGGRVAKTDAEGQAVLNYAGLPSAKYVLVTRVGFTPRIAGLPAADTTIQLSAAQNEGGFPGWWGRHSDAVRVCSIVAPIAIFLGWTILLLRRALELRKWTTPLEPRMRRLGLSIGGGPLFRGSDIRELAIALKRRRVELSHDLNPGRTAEATSRNAGYFTPVAAELTAEPDYLFLGERKNLRDHQARLHDELAQRLRDHDVAIQRYYFQSDPRVCTDLKGGVYSPAELAALHPRHEVWLALDSSRCVDPVRGGEVKWWNSLRQWRDRVLLSSTLPPCDLDVRVAEPTRQGLEALALGTPNSPRTRTPYPSVLTEQPERWLDRSEPPPAAVSRLIAQLARYLGSHGHSLLQACALYPSVVWNITTTLAGELVPLDEVESTLDRLSALPWFRHGMMPDWLRVRLVKGLGPNEARARAALRRYLQTSADAVRRNQEALDFAPSRKAAARRYGPIRDHIYLSFVRGRRLDRLSVEAPRGWRRFLRESMWLRVAAGLIMMLAAVTGATSAVNWISQRSVEQEARAKPPGGPGSAFVARMLDVAEALESTPIAPSGLKAAGMYSAYASDVLNVQDPLLSLQGDAAGFIKSTMGRFNVGVDRFGHDNSPQVGTLIVTAGLDDGGLVKASAAGGVQVFDVARPIPVSDVAFIADLTKLELRAPTYATVPQPPVAPPKPAGRPSIRSGNTTAIPKPSPAPAAVDAVDTTRLKEGQQQTNVTSTPTLANSAPAPITNAAVVDGGTAAAANTAPQRATQPPILVPNSAGKLDATVGPSTAKAATAAASGTSPCVALTMHERTFQSLTLPGSTTRVTLGLSDLYRISRGDDASKLYFINPDVSGPLNFNKGVLSAKPDLTFSFSKYKQFAPFSYGNERYTLTIDQVHHSCIGNGCQTADLTLCVLAHGISASETDSTGAPNPIDGEVTDVTVPAARKWTDTKLEVRQGQTINFYASGQIQWSKGDNARVGPGGSSWKIDARLGSYPVRGMGAGGLIGRIGEKGTPFAVGEKTTIVAPASGRVYLGINDNIFTENSGQFDVKIKVARP